MLENIKAVVMSVVVFIVFLFGVMVIFINASEPKNLDINSFSIQNSNFKQCAKNYEELNDKAITIRDNNFIYLDDDLIQQNYDKYNFETECYTGYVQSSDEQISSYAREVLIYAQEHENNQSVLLLDTVYSTSSDYSAYLGAPKEYLFFTMTEDKSMMMGYIVAPQIDGSIVVNPTWTTEDSVELETLKNYIKKLNLKYNEKINM